MATVTGIGGVFFRSPDPAALAAWYHSHLGIAAGHDKIWQQAEGMTIFAPFEQATDYFPAAQQTMLNLRVDDLAGFITSLTAAGIAVETRPEWDGEYGKFAHIHDLDGNAIELWQPPA